MKFTCPLGFLLAVTSVAFPESIPNSSPPTTPLSRKLLRQGTTSGMQSVIGTVGSEGSCFTNCTFWLSSTEREPYWTSNGFDEWELRNGGGAYILRDDAKNQMPNQRVLYWGSVSNQAQSFRVSYGLTTFPRFTFAYMDNHDNEEVTTWRMYTNYMSHGPDGADVPFVTFSPTRDAVVFGGNVPLSLDATTINMGHAGNAVSFGIEDAILNFTNHGILQATWDVESDLTAGTGLILHAGAFHGNAVGATNLMRTNIVGALAVNAQRVGGTFTNVSAQTAFVSYAVTIVGDQDIPPLVNLALRATNEGVTNIVARCGAGPATFNVDLQLTTILGPNERAWVDETTSTGSFHVTSLSVTRF